MILVTPFTTDDTADVSLGQSFDGAVAGSLELSVPTHKTWERIRLRMLCFAGCRYSIRIHFISVAGMYHKIWPVNVVSPYVIPVCDVARPTCGSVSQCDRSRQCIVDCQCSSGIRRRSDSDHCVWSTLGSARLAHPSLTYFVVVPYFFWELRCL